MRIKFQFFVIQDARLGNPGKKPLRTGLHDVPEFIAVIGLVPLKLDLQDVNLIIFLNVVLQQNLVLGEGFSGLLDFGIVITLFLVKIIETIDTLLDGIKIQDGIQIDPELFLKIFIIELIIAHKHDLAHGWLFNHIKGNHFSRRTVGHIHGYIFEKSHFVDIAKILVQFIQVQPVPGIRAHNSQNSGLFDAPIACHMDGIHLGDSGNPIFNTQSQSFHRLRNLVHILNHLKDEKRHLFTRNINDFQVDTPLVANLGHTPFHHPISRKPISQANQRFIPENF